MTLETADLEEIKPQWRARLEDALSASTRGKRRLLLVTSTISLVIILLGVLPTKIEALGIVFESAKEKELLLLLAAVNFYALVGFLLYAWADMHLQARIQSNANTGYVHEFVKGRARALCSLNGDRFKHRAPRPFSAWGGPGFDCGLPCRARGTSPGSFRDRTWLRP